MNDIYCSPSPTASSSCFILEGSEYNLGKSMLIVSSHHFLPPNVVFTIYSVAHTHKWGVCRRYQPRLYHWTSTEAASKNTLNSQPEPARLPCAKLWCSAFATTFSPSHKGECVHVWTDVYININQPVAFHPHLSKFSMHSWAFQTAGQFCLAEVF